MTLRETLLTNGPKLIKFKFSIKNDKHNYFLLEKSFI